MTNNAFEQARAELAAWLTRRAQEQRERQEKDALERLQREAIEARARLEREETDAQFPAICEAIAAHHHQKAA